MKKKRPKLILNTKLKAVEDRKVLQEAVANTKTRKPKAGCAQKLALSFYWRGTIIASKCGFFLLSIEPTNVLLGKTGMHGGRRRNIANIRQATEPTY